MDKKNILCRILPNYSKNQSRYNYVKKENCVLDEHDGTWIDECIGQFLNYGMEFQL